MLRTFILVSLIASATAVVLGAHRYGTARSTLRTAVSQLESQTRQAERILELRAKTASVADQVAPKEDLLAQVSDALHRCSLPVRTLQAVEPLAPVKLTRDSGGDRLARQDARLMLVDLDPGQLGSLLSGPRRGPSALDDHEDRPDPCPTRRGQSIQRRPDHQRHRASRGGSIMIMEGAR